MPRKEPESAAVPATVVPPEAPPAAETPSSLAQPLSKSLAPSTRKTRIINPAVKAARVRLKRNVTQRSLAPIAGGSVKAKQMLKELEEAAEKHGLSKEEITPNVATTDKVEDSERAAQKEQEQATSLLDSTLSGEKESQQARK